MDATISGPGVPTSPGGARRGRYLFFVLASFGLLMASINHTMVAVALPSMTQSLDVSLAWVSWTLTASQLAMIVAMPVVGRLSDTFGRKQVFMFCVGSFTVGSLLSAVAPNVWTLIIFRAIQGIGAGGLMPSAVGIVSDQFEERRNQAIGLFASVFPIGGLLGPNLAGWVLEHWSWRELFLVNLPIGVLVLIGGQVLLRGDRRPGQRPRFDTLGLALFVSGMIAIMYAMTLAGSDPGAWRGPLFWALLIAGVLAFLLLALQERRAEDPMLDLKLVAQGPFLPANIYNFAFGACIFGFFSFVPYYAVIQYGMSSIQVGAVLTPRALTGIIVSGLTSILLIRLGYRFPMIVGIILVSISLGMLSLGWDQATIGPLEVDAFWLLASMLVLSGLGQGMAAPASNNACIDLVPGKAAAVSGLRGMFRNIGSIMGISSTVLVLSFFEDKAAGMRSVYLAMALVLLLAVPLTLMIPDMARERRRERAAGRVARREGQAAAADSPGQVARPGEDLLG